MSPLNSPQCPQYQTLLRIPLLQTIRPRQPTFRQCHVKKLPRFGWTTATSRCSPTFSAQAQSSHAQPIEFFMHVAFPSSETFRCLSVAEDLLFGLLGVESVVFTVPNCQLGTPLPTDCFAHIGVRDPAQGD
ncbi:glycosyltransferase family 20 protein [Laccaria amethystina LaAM-08-1]|jgi:hypothetical protein|uniref:Glycosyltransferase family 20 protein n=1 Tax=Laccaria amethystina LaAM-08-1 TaxID=1095629 RepID=A0A0C9WPS2_9AGAR|nr:glycosyltransferase family 20 protein [Laccaria amethystina LaAM-08-1]